MTAAEQYTDLRQRLAAKVKEWRKRADDAGPQAHAYTYRYVADEIEREFVLLKPPAVAEPVFAYGERER